MLTAEKYLTDDENLSLQKLFVSPFDRDKLLIAVLYYTGARTVEVVGNSEDLTRKYELIGISPSDVGKEEITIRAAKRGVDRTVPVPRWLCIELLSYALRSGIGEHERIFPITTRKCRRIWAMYRPHGCHKGAKSMRHNVGIRSYLSSQDLNITQQLLGHVEGNTSLIYAKFTHSTRQIRRKTKGMFARKIEE